MVVDVAEAVVHLLFGAERLYYAQSAERLLHLRHGVAPQALCLYRLALELSSHEAHEPSEDGHEDEGEERQLPRDEEQGGEIGDDENGVLEEHVERRHDAAFYLAHVARHACNDVAFALLGEEPEGQRRDLCVELVANVAHHARADGYDGCRREKIGTRLEEGGKGEEQANEQQRRRCSHVAYELRHIIVGVVGHHLLYVVERPRHEVCRRSRSLCAEQDLQDGYEGGEGEDVEHGRQDVEQHRQHKILLVGRYEAPQDKEELFHIALPMSVALVASVISTMTRSPMW